MKNVEGWMLNDELGTFLKKSSRIQHSKFKVQSSKFKVKRSTFNIQHSTSNLQHYLIFLLVLLPLVFFGQNNFRKVENNTFLPGEFLKYRVFYDSWMTSWMTAGFGTIEVDPLFETTNGRETYHITVKGNSAGIFSTFFKVRDRFETYIDKEAMMPLKFIRRTREGGYKKDDDVIFDQVRHIARSNRATKDVPPYVQDIISSFYYMRTWNFDTAKVNDKYFLDFFLDDSVYHSEVIFLGRDIVKTDFGDIPCMKFKPRVAVGEVFQDPYPMELYISDDRNRIPVLMQSAVFVGSVKIELVDYSGLKFPFGEEGH
jgi:hypothetical protein